MLKSHLRKVEIKLNLNCSFILSCLIHKNLPFVPSDTCMRSMATEPMEFDCVNDGGSKEVDCCF